MRKTRASEGSPKPSNRRCSRSLGISEEPLEVVAARLDGPDRLQLRILHRVTADHTVPLTSAAEVVAAFVALIKNGAGTQFTGARASHRGPAGADYEDAVGGIQLLAPAAGSFRLVAISSEHAQIATHPPSLTKTRDALASTLRSVDALGHEPRSADELDARAVERLVDAGVSAQLLAAIDALAISDTSGIELEFSANWDPALGLPDAPTGPVVLGDSHVALARGLRKATRGARASPPLRAVWLGGDRSRPGSIAIACGLSGRHDRCAHARRRSFARHPCRTTE